MSAHQPRVDGNPYRPLWRAAANGAPTAEPAGRKPDAAHLACTAQGCRWRSTEPGARGPEVTQHWLEYKVSLPLPIRRFYFVVLAGPERRSTARLRRERQTEIRRVAFAYFVLITLILTAVGIPLILVGYVVKTLIGLDLLDGTTPLHSLFYG